MSWYALAQFNKKKLPSKYYNNLDYKSIMQGIGGQLKPGYISSSTPLHSGYGDSLYSKDPVKVFKPNPQAGYNSKAGFTYSDGLYIYKDPKIEQQQQQQAYQQQLQATADVAAAANTKQLQIIQGEKSAVSKMTQDYTAMLTKEADAKAKAQKEALAAATVSAAATAANQLMTGKSANLQLQSASGTPKTAGTQGFKKLKNQFKINPSYNALGTMKSGTLNI